MDAVIASALSQLVANGAERVYVDFDIDVVDRAFTPRVPRAFLAACSQTTCFARRTCSVRTHHVVAADLCEVDANADVNGMTGALDGRDVSQLLQRSRRSRRGQSRQ